MNTPPNPTVAPLRDRCATLATIRGKNGHNGAKDRFAVACVLVHATRNDLLREGLERLKEQRWAQ